MVAAFGLTPKRAPPISPFVPIPAARSGACPKASNVAALLALAVIAAVTLPPVPTAAVQSGATGSISGIVRLTAPPRRLNTTGAYPSRRVALAPQRAASELQNVVVFVRRSRPEPPSPIRTEIRQLDEEFVPHMVAVTTGSTVEFPNDDLVFHNVFSLSSAATFDLGRYPQRRSKARTFSKPGIVKVFCHLHSHMSAIVRVFDHPYFAVARDDGQFKIDGLEPGRHEVVAWHERVGEAKASLIVAGGETTEADFTLPLAD
jgi:plastocyanin